VRDADEGRLARGHLSIFINDVASGTRVIMLTIYKSPAHIHGKRVGAHGLEQKCIQCSEYGPLDS
jgi:hypothetical protein